MSSRDTPWAARPLLSDTATSLEEFNEFIDASFYSYKYGYKSHSTPIQSRQHRPQPTILPCARSGGHGMDDDINLVSPKNNKESAGTCSAKNTGLGIATRPRRSTEMRTSRHMFARLPSDPALLHSPISPETPYLTVSGNSPRQMKDMSPLQDEIGSSSRHRHNLRYPGIIPFNYSSMNQNDTESPFSDQANKSPGYWDVSPKPGCPSHKHIYMSRGHWLSVTLLILSAFSTTMSAIYLILAIYGPRYAMVHEKKAFSISTATLLVAFFAKLIELSFVTVFVAFIGQVISRRAFMTKHGRGITLAEMSMRNWIMQPGSMITQLDSVRFGILSLLGVLAMCAAWVAMLYTSASAALVSPQLRYGDFTPKTMAGTVNSVFANAQYVASVCKTPITTDPEYASDTCLQLEHAAQSYYNYYETYIRKWSNIARSGNGSTSLKERLPGTGLLQENVTVTGAWIGIHNMTLQSEAAGRTINNVSMAMPHAGVYHAAMDSVNHILTPEGNEGLGALTLRASVPSPVVHVLCVNISSQELQPMIYSTWPGAERQFNASDWPNQLASTAKWRNTTAVDDLFGWNGHGGGYVPPVFAKYPMDYNTIINDTVGSYGNHDAIYLLAKAGMEHGNNYNLCSIRGGVTPLCSTHFNATSSGGTMKAVCDDDHNPMRYLISQPDSYTGNITVSLDYPYLAESWARALALSDGITDGKASNARLLTQLIPQDQALDPKLPSIAEALAVMAGGTLLMSTKGAPFVQFWNYSEPILEEGVYQYFNASVRSKQYYAGGGGLPYQRGFYLVLFLVFAFNVLVLGWFLYHKGLVTDFSEPPNLFSLSINSPPSQSFAGSCGGGPNKDQYKVSWFVNIDGEHVFLENGRRSGVLNVATTPTTPGNTASSPIVDMYSKLSKQRSIL